jgi:hypothetical protein
MTDRLRLPNRRASETFELQCADLAYISTISRFPNGQVAEVFLSNHKGGSHADTAARDAAIACGLALQHGADVEAIRKAVCRDARGNTSEPLGVALDMVATATMKEGATPISFNALCRSNTHAPMSFAATAAKGDAAV